MNHVSPSVTTSDPVDAVRQWFALMGRYCASEDYDGAERIFAIVALDTLKGREKE